ncbi:glycosyltransferase family 2 protein, partial [Bacillus sp. RHFS18]|nr:glycosyltransferase family 2 protein [Bacillus sp. RHFS18]
METPAVSLLIAVYNTETYLERCLDSLLNQSLANIEIVAVNDGSTDQSPAILETYQKRDERIRVIHQQNR